ncbi:MAG: metal ABC transporter ATP-binding protein [Desulfovibrio sp.]|nr:metal ABC transporter ATP-binding protein [Desulfovibrio sp.]
MPGPETSAPALRFESLSVRLGRQQILEDIRADVPAGSSTVLVGPNGAGKTTLLHCLLGNVRYSGQIHVDWSDGAQRPLDWSDGAQRPRIGYVPQHLQAEAGLPLLVSEFLALSHQLRPLWLGLKRKIRDKIHAAMHLVHAGHLADCRLGDLSGGELRRVLLANALALNPLLLILDEPAVGVDIQGEHLFWAVLDAARIERGFTLLMVSHNLSLAARYATRMICLNKRVIAQGEPRSALTAGTLLELFSVPIHLYPDQCRVANYTCPQCGT